MLDVDGDTVLFAASDEPTETHLWTYPMDGGARRFTDTAGVHSGYRVGGTTVVVSESLGHDGPQLTVHPHGGSITSLVETAVIRRAVPRGGAGTAHGRGVSHRSPAGIGQAERYPDLDLPRVAIRGWSYGGYLAALAVLRRPDVLHAAVAGAAPSDQALYDTHFNERYLGQLHEAPEAYARCNLILDAPKLRRPLMLIHGLADDNVFAAHTLLLSSALLAAGRPHTVLPLSGDSHRIHQPVVAENLFTIELDFLLSALNRSDAGGASAAPAR